MYYIYTHIPNSKYDTKLLNKLLNNYEQDVRNNMSTIDIAYKTFFYIIKNSIFKFNNTEMAKLLFNKIFCG